jgi:putative DNA primase/helicase
VARANVPTGPGKLSVANNAKPTPKLTNAQRNDARRVGEQLSLHPALILGQRDIALAADSEQLRALQDSAIRVAPLVASGEIPKPDAVDALCDAAKNNGLYARYRAGDIEHVVGMGLSGAPALAPRSPRNAGDAFPGSHVHRAALASRSDGMSRRSSAVHLRRLADVAPEPVQWLWAGRLACGKLTLIAGDAGIGKSQLSLDIAARISTGNVWPDGERAALGNVVILSAEDGHADTLRPRLDAADADVSRVHALTAVTGEDGARRTFDLAADLAALEEAVIAIGAVRLIIVDPITSYMGRIDSHRTTDVRRVLEPLADFGERLGVAVLTISHPPKAAPARALHAVTGSYAYVAAARMVFLVAEEPETNRRLLLPIKNNLTAQPDGLGFNLAQRIIGDGIVASHVIWSTKPVSMTADEALAVAAEGRERNGALSEAKDFLINMLAAGPVPAKDVQRQATEAGIAPRTLRRARETLGIEPRRTGGLGREGAWTWELSSKVTTES